MRKKKRITLERSGPSNPKPAILSSKKLSKKEIRIKLKLAPATEDKLRKYVKREFNTTLEKKLKNVLIMWIGKAIENSRIFIIFILLLTTPLYAEEFKIERSFNDKPIFNTLQFTGYALIDLDTFCTYRSRWHYGLGEANPFWRTILDKPALVFALDMAIKTGIIWGTSWLYKKNKAVAYFLIAAVNIVQIYCVCSHLEAWRRLKN